MSQVEFQPKSTTYSHVRIGDVVIDLRCRQVVTPDDTVELPQRMFDLLLLLVSEPHALHSRSSLFERVWPGLVVEDGNLNQSISMLRKAFGLSRKSWIRTVAKSGYMFEPPFAIEPFDGIAVRPGVALPEGLVETVLADASHASDVGMPAGQRRHGIVPSSRVRSIVRGMGASVALCALLLLSGSSAPGQGDSTTSGAMTLAQLPIQVAVVREVGAATAAAWPAQVLEEWLSWKFRLLPQAVVQASSMSQHGSRKAVKITVLPAIPMEGRPGRIVLRLLIEDRGPGAAARQAAPAQLLSMDGTLQDVPALVDALSREALMRTMPRGESAQWPAMNLTSSLAEKYASAAYALNRRDWQAGYDAIQDVIAGAPAFGPAYLKRAEILHRQGRTDEALTDMNRALDLLVSAPAEARRSLAAVEAWMDPRRLAQGADMNCRLARQYPARDDFSLSCASLLFRTGRNHDALALLGDPARRWSDAVLATRVRYGVISSEVLLGLGDPDQSKRSAEAVVRMLASNARGWELELGRARMLIARSFHRQPGGQEAPELFELASDAFEAGGNHFDALYASVLAEAHRASTDDPMSAKMRALLVDAHRSGYLKMEVELLQQAAYIHRAAGRIQQYRALLRAAETAALDSDDVSSLRNLDLDLLQEDIWLANFASAASRVERLRASGVEGAQVVDLQNYQAQLDWMKGFYPQSLSRLRREQVRRALPDGPLLPDDAAYEACLRAEILLARGETDGARTQVGHCRALGNATLRLRANALGAKVSLHEGDPEGARALMSGIERKIEELPDATERWTTAIEAATVLAKLGECDRSQRLFQSVRPEVDMSGYRLMQADIGAGLAEIAGARGDWAESRRLAREVRRWVPADLWVFSNRLDMLAILDERMTGTPADVQAGALRALALRRGDVEVIRQLDRASHGAYRCMPSRTS